MVYTPRSFIPHAALLRHAFAHCGRFVTAASRRSPGSVSVPMRRVMLSHPLAVLALVGRYPTNKLIAHSPISRQQAFAHQAIGMVGLSSITPSFPELSLTLRHVRNVFLALSPLYLYRSTFAFDLHVLTMPPAFNLSQDQTLQFNSWHLNPTRRPDPR